MTHALKTWPQYFKEVKSGNKPFEVRKDDRDFREGDKVILQEWDPETEKYTGQELEFKVGYLLVGFGIKKGYCVFGLEEINS